MSNRLLMVFLLVFSTTAFTAEEPNTSKAEENAQDEPQPGVQSTTSAGAPQKKANKEAGDIFQPSEEISEDFAVSFPVDI